MDSWVILLFLLGGLIALGIIILLLCAAFAGAMFVLELAAEQGFIGIAVYIACWVFFFPVMLVICVIIGLFILWTDRD